jgi:hypothetical protein
MHQQKYSGSFFDLAMYNLPHLSDHAITRNKFHAIIAPLLFITIMGGLHQPRFLPAPPQPNIRQ